MINIISKVEGINIDVIKAIEKVSLTAMKELNEPIKNIALNVYFVGEKKIRTINRERREIDRVTDVLSFPMLDIKAGEIINLDEHKIDVDPYNNTLTIGEIIICNKVAKSQAKKYGHSYIREVAFLFLHGLLHCLGYDHIKDEDRVVMEEMQTRILNKCNITRD